MARNDDVRLEGRDPLELVWAAINTSQAELRELREEVRGTQEDTAAKLAALTTERPYSFRKKGHEEQYVFNSAINSKIAEAGLQLARVERGVADGAVKVALDAAKEALTKDVLTAGVWPVLRNLEDPELQRLAEALPTTVLSSRADSTTKKYLGAFKRWKLWAEARQGVPVFLVQDIHLALYLQHLGESVESRAAAEEAVHALAWLHQVAGLPSVGDSPLVRVTLAGLGRRLARPKVRKGPVTADMLRAMVDSVGQEPSLSDVRLLAVCLVAFAGFMRCDELLKLHCSDVAFGTESMTITIVSSKTDQYREGSSLVIARTGTLTCPVAMMEKYFFMGGLCTHDQGKVFRAIDSTKIA